MPLNLADIETDYKIIKISGNQKSKHYLESLGFVVGEHIHLLSHFFGYFIVMIKETKIGIDKNYAKMIIVESN